MRNSAFWSLVFVEKSSYNKDLSSTTSTNQSKLCWRHLKSNMLNMRTYKMDHILLRDMILKPMVQPLLLQKPTPYEKHILLLIAGGYEAKSFVKSWSSLCAEYNEVEQSSVCHYVPACHIPSFRHLKIRWERHYNAHLITLHNVVCCYCHLFLGWGGKVGAGYIFASFQFQSVCQLSQISQLKRYFK